MALGFALAHSHKRLTSQPKDSDTAVLCRRMRDQYGWVATVASLPLVKQALALRPDSKSAQITLPYLDENQIVRFGEGPSGDLAACFNCHVMIYFDDGEKWYARVKRTAFQDHDPPLVRLSSACEFEALTLLKTFAPRWISESWMPEQPQDGPSYFFLKPSPGKSSYEMDVPLHAYGDLAEFYIDLTSVSFQGIGSFHPQATATAAWAAPATVTAGGLGGTAPCHPRIPGVLFDRFTAQRFKSCLPIGPFKTNRDHYLAKIDHVLALIRDGLAHRTDPVFAYLAHSEARALVDQDAHMAREEPTYIMHQDLRPPNMLFDQDRHITAVIDWEWASTAPLVDVISTCDFLVHVGPGEEYTNEMYESDLLLIAEFEKRGRTDLAEAVRGSRKYSQLKGFLLGFGWRDRVATSRFFWYLREAFLGVNPDPKFATKEEWTALALERYKDDAGLQTVIKNAEEAKAAKAAKEKEEKDKEKEEKEVAEGTRGAAGPAAHGDNEAK